MYGQSIRHEIMLCVKVHLVTTFSALKRKRGNQLTIYIESEMPLNGSLLKTSCNISCHKYWNVLLVLQIF